MRIRFLAFYFTAASFIGCEGFRGQNNDSRVDDLKSQVIRLEKTISEIKDKPTASFEIYYLGKNYPPMILNTTTGEVAYLEEHDHADLGKYYSWISTYNFMLPGTADNLEVVSKIPPQQ